MRKISNAGDANDSSKGALGSSLTAIKQAHDQFHVLTSMGTTASVLASQIELCNVLLVEITGIRSSLVNDLNHSRRAPQPGDRAGLNA
jgi:hypothetical protein